MPFNNSQLNTSLQNDLIRRHGEWLDYRMAMKCSCSVLPTGAYRPDANRANPNCKMCKGLGILWHPKKTILGVVMTITQQKDLLDAGIATPGDLILLPDLRYTVSDYDKIVVEWKEGIPYEGELLTRSGTGSVDTVNYEIADVVSCVQVDPETGDMTTYTPDVDFTFSGRTITWIQNAPAASSFYSIKYSAVVEWICFAPPQPRVERSTNLGQRVVMRKKHLIAFGQ